DARAAAGSAVADGKRVRDRQLRRRPLRGARRDLGLESVVDLERISQASDGEMSRATRDGGETSRSASRGRQAGKTARRSTHFRRAAVRVVATSAHGRSGAWGNATNKPDPRDRREISLRVVFRAI